MDFIAFLLHLAGLTFVVTYGMSCYNVLYRYICHYFNLYLLLHRQYTKNNHTKIQCLQHRRGVNIDKKIICTLIYFFLKR